MTLEEILEGFEQALALERELGVRSVEIDRTLLAQTPPAHVSSPPHSPTSVPSPVPAPSSFPASAPKPPPRTNNVKASAAPAAERSTKTSGQEPRPFIFLSGEALSPAGAEMMAKVAVFMGATPETAPVVWEGEMPKAGIYVVLGSAALKKWFPGKKAAPGQWIRIEGAGNVVVTRSPDIVLAANSQKTVKELKSEMLAVFKAVLQRMKQ